MREYRHTITTPGSYSWDTAGDIYGTLIVVPSGAATYYVESANGQDDWAVHPDANASYVNGIGLVYMNQCANRVRVRVASQAAQVDLHYCAGMVTD